MKSSKRNLTIAALFGLAFGVNCNASPSVSGPISSIDLPMIAMANEPSTSTPNLSLQLNPQNPPKEVKFSENESGSYQLGLTFSPREQFVFITFLLRAQDLSPNGRFQNLSVALLDEKTDSRITPWIQIEKNNPAIWPYQYGANVMFQDLNLNAYSKSFPHLRLVFSVNADEQDDNTVTHFVRIGQLCESKVVYFYNLDNGKAGCH